MKVELKNKIDKFIKVRRTTDGDDWAPVKDKDIVQLNSIIEGLLEAKFDKDCDGDLPLDIRFINRNKYMSDHRRPIPYPHKDFSGFFTALIGNISYYSGLLDNHSRNRLEIKIKD